jgi:hypothetical protein
MEFKLLGEKAEVEALNKYPSGCVKHLGLVKYMKNLCKRQQAVTLAEVAAWLDAYAHFTSVDPRDLADDFKKMIEQKGVAVV